MGVVVSLEPCMPLAELAEMGGERQRNSARYSKGILKRSNVQARHRI